MISKHLDDGQVKGLLKLGDVLLPGGDGLPSFGDTGFVREVDRMLDHMTDGDRADVMMLLGLMRSMPRAGIKGILRLSNKDKWFPGALGANLRMLQVGVKGVAMALYYSDFSDDGAIGKAVGFEAGIGTDPRTLDGQARSVEAYQTMLANRAAFAGTSTEAGDVEAAFAAVRRAAPLLRDMPMAVRLGRIEALRQVILDHRDRILDEVQAATGKTRTDALVSEVFAVLDHLVYLEKNATAALRPEVVPTPIALMGKKSAIHYEPLGPILVISPWNYPFYQAIVPITSAFAAGNPVLYKPSEHTPLRGLVEDLLRKAGWDDDWVQVVYGDGETGRALIDGRPAKVFFTGSTATGKAIMRQAADHLIPVELELGGKDPMVVFDDVDVRRAAAGAAWGAFTNSGQSCTSVERLYVHDALYERFRDALVAEADRLSVGIDRHGDKDVGSMTTAFQVETVRRHLDDALAKGASVINTVRWDGESTYIPPMVLEGVTDDMLVAREETFGPLLPLWRFTDEAEVVARCNDSPYGLSASVWSKDLDRAHRVAAAIETGNVSINNVMVTEGNSGLPFGGTKQSGIGRYKGVHGLRAFTNMKSVMHEKDRSAVEANWYPYDRRKYALFDRLTEKLYRGRPGPGFAVAGLRLESHADKAHKKRKE